jgi:3-phosphoshikimate 1-carboxyvinyltransferase
LALLGGDYRLHGVPRMHERPIGDLVDGLRMIGAVVEYEQHVGYPPIRVGTGQIRSDVPLAVRGDVSSQFLTALLLALPLVARTPVTINVMGTLISKPYVELTMKLMTRFGVHVSHQHWQQFVVPGCATAPYHSPGTLWVEGDASSASYFLAAGAIAGGPVRVHGVGQQSIQGDVAFVDAIRQMGARVHLGEHWIEVTGVSHADGRLRGITIDCLAIPDAAMTLAVMALFATGTTTLTGIGSWRVKETDRIAAMHRELRKVGAIVSSGADWLSIVAPKQWQSPAEGIDTYDDHRMAMCFSLASFAGIPIRINEPGCVAKTFPDYFDAFAQITHMR